MQTKIFHDNLNDKELHLKLNEIAVQNGIRPNEFIFYDNEDGSIVFNFEALNTERIATMKFTATAS